MDHLNSNIIPSLKNLQTSGKKGAGGDNNSTAEGADANTEAPTKDAKGKKAPMSYYRVACNDNGCGMPHEKIPEMLGRVLSGSKYGVRQTR